MADSRGTRPSTTAIDPHDPLGLDRLLSSDELSVREAVRTFAAKEVAPHVAEWFEAGEVPDVRGLARRLGELGLLGMQIEGYGCAGMSAVDYGLACVELEAVDSGLRSFVSVQGSLAMHAVHAYGSDEQRAEWLPRLATGEAIGCFGLTEPDHGSDPSSMRTRARRDASGDWVLDGSKAWITNGTVADVAVVWARTEEGIAGFLVPAGVPGLTTQEVNHKGSLRASVTAELSFDSVRLPAGAALPTARGLRAALGCLTEARYGIVWGCLGAARTAYECALAYALEREQFGKPVAGFQLTQAKLAQMVVRLQQGQLLALHLGRRKDAGELLPEQVSFGKLANVRAALEVCRSARTVLGANGLSYEYPVLRHMVNLETVLTYEGTEEMHALVVGQALTGLAAFR